MKYILIALLFVCGSAHGQLTYYIRSDSVKIEKTGGSNELFIKNATRGVNGVLTNVGGGKTRFIASRVSGDTLFIGMDTLVGVGAAAGSAGSQDRYLYYPIVFDQYAFRDSTLTNSLAGITSLYFDKGLILKGTTTPVTSSYIRAWNYGYLVNENTSQRLVFEVMDSATTIEIGIGIKGSGQLNARDQYSYITGTLGDSANTDLHSIQTTAGDNQVSSGVLINQGDFIEITVNQWADSVVTFYRNMTNNNSIKLVRHILTTNSGSSTRMGYPTVFFGNGHVRLIDWSVYQPDFDIMFIGNSITVGHHASAFDTTFVGRLQAKTASKINNTSKSSATTIDYTNVKNDFNFRNKIVILSGLIGNDPQGGLTATQSKAYYEQVVAKLKANGNKVIHTTITYRTTFMGSATWADFFRLNNWLDTAYGAVDKVIRLDTITAAMLDDGVHLNDAGMGVVYNSILRGASEYFERGNPVKAGVTPIYGGTGNDRVLFDSAGFLATDSRFVFSKSSSLLQSPSHTINDGYLKINTAGGRIDMGTGIRSTNRADMFLLSAGDNASGQFFGQNINPGYSGIADSNYTYGWSSRASSQSYFLNLYECPLLTNKFLGGPSNFFAARMTVRPAYLGGGISINAAPSYANTAPWPGSAFSVYGSMFIADTARMDEIIPTTDSSSILATTGWVKRLGLSGGGGGGGITGSGTSGQVTMWNGTGTVTGTAGFTFDGTTAKAGGAGNTFGELQAFAGATTTTLGAQNATMHYLSTTTALPFRFYRDATIAAQFIGTDFIVGTTDNGSYSLQNNGDFYNSGAATIVGNLTAANVLSGFVASPTGTAILNVDAVTIYEMQWSRVGNIITFSCALDIDATVAGGATVDIDLPVASNFTSSLQGNGVCNEKAGGGTAAMGGYVEVNAGTDKIRATVTARTTSATTYTLTGQYRII